MSHVAEPVDLKYFNDTLLSYVSPNPGTYYFLNEDSEENWNVNKIKYADICQKNYYSNTAIVYHVNRLGHRNKLNPVQAMSVIWKMKLRVPLVFFHFLMFFMMKFS
jgi:hypothetical protein